MSLPGSIIVHAAKLHWYLAPVIAGLGDKYLEEAANDDGGNRYLNYHHAHP